MFDSLKSEDRTEVEESDSHQGIGAVSKKGYHSVLPPLHGDFPAYAQPVPVPRQYEISQYHAAAAVPAVYCVNGVPCADSKKV